YSEKQVLFYTCYPRFLSDETRNDKDLMFNLIRFKRDSLCYLGNELKNDKNFFMEIFTKLTNPMKKDDILRMFNFFSKTIQLNESEMFSIISICPYLIHKYSIMIWTFDLLKKLLKNDGNFLYELPDQFHNNLLYYSIAFKSGKIKDFKCISKEIIRDTYS